MPEIILGPSVWTWRGAYSAIEVYHRLDIVTFNNGSYMRTADGAAGIDPTTASHWKLITQNPLSSAFQPLGKLDYHSPVFVKRGAQRVALKAGTVAPVGGVLQTFNSETDVIIPSLTPGRDYAVYICDDGTVRADESFTAPAGYTAAQCLQIGGFHFGLSNLNIDSTPNVNEFSFWDLLFRPACPDPRGMVRVDDFWVDIYFLAADHLTGGTSQAGVAFASQTTAPKVPLMFGGDGSANYGGLKWPIAAEILASHGKRLLTFTEFMAAAHGVDEQTALGAPVTVTGHHPGMTSQWGIEQATGVQMTWGSDNGGLDTGGVYVPLNDGRGSVLNQPRRALMGGYDQLAAESGSRSVSYEQTPEYSAPETSARGMCKHRADRPIELPGVIVQAPTVPLPNTGIIQNIQGLVTFIDAAEEGDQTFNGAVVAAAADLSGNGRDATAPVLSQPEWLSGDVNGLGAYQFDSNTDADRHFFVANNDDALDDFDSNGCYLQITVRPEASLGPSPFPRLWAQSDTFYLHGQAGPDATAHRIGFYRRFDGTDAHWVSVNAPLIVGQVNIIEFIYDALTHERPEIRVNGNTIQLSGVGSTGTPLSTAGEGLCFANRTQNEDASETFDRGFQGTVYSWMVINNIPTLSDQRTALVAVAERRRLAYTNPFVPNIEAQAMNVRDDAQIGDVVGVVAGQGLIDRFVMTGGLLDYFAIDSDTGIVTVNAALPVLGTIINGSVQVTSDEYGSDTASLSITVADVAQLLWDIPEWVTAPTTKYYTPSSASSITIGPGFNLPDGQGTLQADDYLVIRGSADQVLTDRLTVQNIAGVAMIGGRYKHEGDFNNPPSQDSIIRLNNIRQEIFCAWVTVEPAYGNDAFQFDGPNTANRPLCTFQYCRGPKLDAVDEGDHADWLQPLGPTGLIRVWRNFWKTGYQGVFFDNQRSGGSGADILGVEMYECDGEHLNLDPNVGHEFSFHIYLDDTGIGDYPLGVKLGDDNYLTLKNGQNPPNGVFDPQVIAPYTGDSNSGVLTVAGAGENGGAATIHLANAIPPRPGGEKCGPSDSGGQYSDYIAA